VSKTRGGKGTDSPAASVNWRRPGWSRKPPNSYTGAELDASVATFGAQVKSETRFDVADIVHFHLVQRKDGSMTELYADQPALPNRYASSAFRRDSVFFGGMALLLAIVVFAGFAPTFYLRSPSRDLPHLSPLLIVHGILFSAWMFLYPVQTLLVAAGAIRWHRRLGFAGAVLAASMVVLGIAVQLAHTRRIMLDGSYASNALVEDMGMSLGLLDIMVFAAFVSAAIWFRRRPDEHKRLILLATTALIGPAVILLPGITSLPAPVIVSLPIAPVVPLMLHDLLTRKRLLSVTTWGTAITVGYHALAFAFVGAGGASALARWIAS
jgi:hypothetical protein